MAPHSSTLAWKILSTQEPGRLQSMRLLRVGHNWATSLSRIGEGNGNPLQCSCLENPRDRGAWWVAVYGVAQSRTRMKRLSSSSSMKQKAWMVRCLRYELDKASYTDLHRWSYTCRHIYGHTKYHQFPRFCTLFCVCIWLGMSKETHEIVYLTYIDWKKMRDYSLFAYLWFVSLVIMNIYCFWNCKSRI